MPIVASAAASVPHATKNVPCSFAEHLEQNVLGPVPIRQYVVTIPKMLRLCFKYDRKLLGALSRCFYLALKELFQDGAADRQARPGMIASLQTYGDDPTRFHPHLHCLVADGLLLPDGSFIPIPRPDPVRIMLLFRHKLLKLLLAREKISPHLVEILLSWRHPGFSVFQGDPVSPDDHQSRQRLASYICHPPMALERLHYDPQTRQVAYDRKNTITAPAPRLLPPLPARRSTSWPAYALIYPMLANNSSGITARFPTSAAPAPDKQQPRRSR